MNTRRSGAALLITGLVLATAAGCASGAGETGPDSSATPTEKQTLAPTASSSPSADPQDPTTWIISDAGVGPIEIGAQLDETLTQLPDTWTNDENCSWTAWWNSEDSSYGVFFVRGTESDDAPLREISVYTAAEEPVAVPSPVTEAGLGIGATKEEVVAAYPGAEEGEAPIGGGTWLKLPGEGQVHVFFEFREGATGASDVVVTVGEQPSYEVCG